MCTGTSTLQERNSQHSSDTQSNAEPENKGSEQLVLHHLLFKSFHTDSILNRNCEMFYFYSMELMTKPTPLAK